MTKENFILKKQKLDLSNKYSCINYLLKKIFSKYTNIRIAGLDELIIIIVKQ